MLILGLETSCDDTGVGIVDENRRIHANIVASQLAAHAPYGGVVPEIAARAHLDVIEDVVHEALKAASVTISDIAAVAATTGPGLVGGVMIGSMMGKAIAAVQDIPFLSINHLEAHALTARLTHDVDFPYLLLLASGGHCQLLLVRGVGEYRLLGQTIDDAVGECFDKCAKMLGLGYPGGPLIEKAAENGNPIAFNLPRPMVGRAGCDFSFSGLKTAVRTLLQHRELSENVVADMAASLQTAISETVADRAQHAFDLLRKEQVIPTCFVASGGVAANRALGARLALLATGNGTPFVAPPARLCTDNGAMIAWAGLERLRIGRSDGLDTKARPRWPLEELLTAK